MNQIWEDAISLDPEIPTVRIREGWRGIEGGIDGSSESWKESLTSVAVTVTIKFSEQIAW